MTLPDKLRALLAKDENGLLPCRKCGSNDIDHWHGKGTQAEIYCNECGEGDSVQVSDVLDYAERYDGTNDWNQETISYPDKTVQRARTELHKRWNERAANPLILELLGVITQIHEAAFDHTINHLVHFLSDSLGSDAMTPAMRASYDRYLVRLKDAQARQQGIADIAAPLAALHKKLEGALPLAAVKASTIEGQTP